MKINEISYDIIKVNMKKNYKLMILILSAFIIIGIITGLISAHLYNAEKTISVKQVEKHVDLEKLEKNEAYYYNAFLTLKEKNDYIQAYLEYFTQVNLSSESRVELDKIEEKIFDYQQHFEEAKLFFYKNAPAYVDKIDLTIKFYEEKKDSLEYLKEERNNELNEINAGNYTENYKDVQQKDISEDIAKIQKNIDMFNNHINILRNSEPSEISKNSKEADLLLYENCNELNNIIDDFNDVMKNVAEKENYEIIYNKRLLKEYSDYAGFNNELEQEDILNNQKEQAVIYAKSIAGLDQKNERFFATLTFFILCGIVISIVVGAVYAHSNRKK